MKVPLKQEKSKWKDRLPLEICSLYLPSQPSAFVDRSSSFVRTSFLIVCLIAAMSFFNSFPRLFHCPLYWLSFSRPRLTLWRRPLFWSPLLKKNRLVDNKYIYLIYFTVIRNNRLNQLNFYTPWLTLINSPGFSLYRFEDPTFHFTSIHHGRTRALDNHWENLFTGYPVYPLESLLTGYSVPSGKPARRVPSTH